MSRPCILCLDPMWEMITLPCLHTFCLTCIKAMVESNLFTCSLCRQPLPEKLIEFFRKVPESPEPFSDEEEDLPLSNIFRDRERANERMWLTVRHNMEHRTSEIHAAHDRLMETGDTRTFMHVLTQDSEIFPDDLP